jgi:hypothetical protein
MCKPFFVGIAWGGAVASLCALKYILDFDITNTNSRVLLVTFGQPKTIKKESEKKYIEILGLENYLRLVAMDQDEKTTDCVTGYRCIKDKDPDTAGCCHTGKRLNVNTGIIVKNNTWNGKMFGWVREKTINRMLSEEKKYEREVLGLRERIFLHPMRCYSEGKVERSKKPYQLRITKLALPGSTSEHLSEEQIRQIILKELEGLKKNNELQKQRFERMNADVMEKLQTTGQDVTSIKQRLKVVEDNKSIPPSSTDDIQAINDRLMALVNQYNQHTHSVTVSVPGRCGPRVGTGTATATAAKLNLGTAQAAVRRYLRD